MNMTRPYEDRDTFMLFRENVFNFLNLILMNIILCQTSQSTIMANLKVKREFNAIGMRITRNDIQEHQKGITFILNWVHELPGWLYDLNRKLELVDI